MTKTKFYSCKTNEGSKMINISNIASIEDVNDEIIITLNVKKNKETNISFVVNESWRQVSGDIDILVIQQNLQ